MLEKKNNLKLSLTGEKADFGQELGFSTKISGLSVGKTLKLKISIFNIKNDKTRVEIKYFKFKDTSVATALANEFLIRPEEYLPSVLDNGTLNFQIETFAICEDQKMAFSRLHLSLSQPSNTVKLINVLSWLVKISKILSKCSKTTDKIFGNLRSKTTPSQASSYKIC